MQLVYPVITGYKWEKQHEFGDVPRGHSPVTKRDDLPNQTKSHHVLGIPDAHAKTIGNHNLYC